MIQAVILASGKGTRQRPLTFNCPKPLLKVGGTTILEHNLQALKGLVEEVIIIEGKRGGKIFQKIGDSFEGIRIRYAYQREALGTGDALQQAQPYCRERFLVLNGDDLYSQKDIKKALEKFPSILGQEVEDSSSFGVILEKGGVLKKLIEKPKKGTKSLVNTGLYFLDRRIFKTKLTKSERGEFELTQAVENFAKKIKTWVIQANDWIPLSYPWDLLRANQFLLKQQKRHIDSRAQIEEGVAMKGAVVIGAGTIIKSGSYLEGPLWIGENNQIGPQAYLRPGTMIEDNCRIGAGVEVKNSIIGSKSQISHLSYIGDSIIGHHCHLGAGTVIANLRFDQQLVKVEVKGERRNTGLRKFGAVLGDGVQTGIHSSVMPGVLIDPGIIIWPNSLVKKNIKNPTLYQ